MEYDRCRPVNWDTVPTLDCIVCCILEWAHSILMDKWSTQPAGLEYKVTVSEWLLHSSKDDYYLFSPTDKDSHAPLLVHLNPRYFKPADVRATMRTETKMDQKARRKERQKLNKRRRPVLHLVLRVRQALYYRLPGARQRRLRHRQERLREDRVRRRLLLLRKPVEPSQRLPWTRASPKPKTRGPTSDDAGKGKSKSKGDSHREKGRAKDTQSGKAKARSERGLRRMLKDVSGISNRGPSQSVFTAPRGCE